MFVRLKKYNDLITFCSREQGRRQLAELEIKCLEAEIEILNCLKDHYQRKAERLEQEAKPRAGNGQYNRVIPIHRVEIKS